MTYCYTLYGSYIYTRQQGAFYYYYYYHLYYLPKIACAENTF